MLFVLSSSGVFSFLACHLMGLLNGLHGWLDVVVLFGLLLFVRLLVSESYPSCTYWDGNCNYGAFLIGLLILITVF